MIHKNISECISILFEYNKTMIIFTIKNKETKTSVDISYHDITQLANYVKSPQFEIDYKQEQALYIKQLRQKLKDSSEKVKILTNTLETLEKQII